MVMAISARGQRRQGRRRSRLSVRSKLQTTRYAWRDGGGGQKSMQPGWRGSCCCAMIIHQQLGLLADPTTHLVLASTSWYRCTDIYPAIRISSSAYRVSTQVSAFKSSRPEAVLLGNRGGRFHPVVRVMVITTTPLQMTRWSPTILFPAPDADPFFDNRERVWVQYDTDRIMNASYLYIGCLVLCLVLVWSVGIKHLVPMVKVYYRGPIAEWRRWLRWPLSMHSIIPARSHNRLTDVGEGRDPISG